MRDGLSLLDQLIAFGGGKAGEAEARAHARHHRARPRACASSSCSRPRTPPALLRCAQSLEECAPDYAQVLDELAALLVRVGFRQAVPDYEGDELVRAELLERLAQALSPEDVQLYYQTAIIGRRDLALAPEPRSGFEMTLLRMLAFRPAALPAAARGAGAEARAAAARAAAAPAPRAPAPRGAQDSATRCRRGRGAPRRGDPAAWTQILGQIELTGAARQLASHCAYLGRHGQRRAPGAGPAVPGGAHAGAGGQARRRRCRGISARAVRLEFQAAGGGRDAGPGAAARGRAGARPGAARLRDRSGRAGTARALRRDRATRDRPPGKMSHVHAPHAATLRDP